jgi:hypothetical protein
VDATLFLHILSATALFGATGAVGVLALFGRRRDVQLPLARVSFWTMLVLAIPSWVLVMVFGEWTKSQRHFPDGIGWIDTGRAIADVGLVVVLGGTALAYVWTRRPAGGWPVTVLGAGAALYCLALAVAWWVMSAKVPA